jgi:uncharacterized iron-regulated membrane protein
MQKFKKITGKIHLWLGLTSGLVVFIVSITGCLYAFQEEIQDATEPFRFVEVQNLAMLPPASLQDIANRALPNKHLHAVMYSGGEHAAQAIFYHYEPSYYYIVYLNPYTGEVLKVKDMDKDFFRIVLNGHYYLWLPPAIGQPVVASATLIFFVLLITGIILWWPKNKSAVKQRFNIKWNAQWRRKNYDLHNVLGFYASWIVVVIVITGLVWGFQWFASSVYWTIGGQKSLQYQEPVSNVALKNLKEPCPMPAIDQIWYRMLNENPNAASIEVHIPETDSSSIAVNINAEHGTYWQTDYRYFDQFSLKEQHVGHVYGRIAEATQSDKLFRMNYDIHVGAIFGLAGKVLAFLVSLVSASLPVTGVIIWWGRRKKNKKMPSPTTKPSISSVNAVE